MSFDAGIREGMTKVALSRKELARQQGYAAGDSGKGSLIGMGVGAGAGAALGAHKGLSSKILHESLKKGAKDPSRVAGADLLRKMPWATRAALPVMYGAGAGLLIGGLAGGAYGIRRHKREMDNAAKTK